MKKIAIILLMLLYAGVSSGISLRLHYCMGDLVDAAWVDKGEVSCGRCGMEQTEGTTKGCCSTEQHQWKADDQDQLAKPYSFGWAPQFEAIVSVFYVPQAVPLTTASVSYPTANGPPERPRIPLFLLQCNFRI